MLDNTAPRSVLVFRIGSLGDTLVAVPAMHAIRGFFQNARVTLLCDFQVGQRRVLAADLLEGSGLIDDFLRYPVDDSLRGRLAKPFRTMRLLALIRRMRFDALVYLAPTGRSDSQIARDRRFFELAGIRRLFGMEGFTDLPPAARRPLATLPREADLLLKRLGASGIPAPSAGEGNMDLGLGPVEEAQVLRWIEALPHDGGRPWVGFGIGAKQPAKLWPLERFAQVGNELIRRFDIWPVIFGSREEAPAAQRLTAQWERGHIAAGRLSLRATAAAMKRCALHIGNDSGTIHLAAAAGVPCVGIYSSRTYPGLWYPYGTHHAVLRIPIACEGCELLECIERKMQCILSIHPADVVSASERWLQRGANLNPRT